jgi:hypothetical protein
MYGPGKKVGANLTGADLTGANLTGANLTGADLTGATLPAALQGTACLRGANLRGQNLSQRDLSNCDLSSCDLTGANLTGANLNRANLKDANLTGVDLSKAMNVPPQKSNISRSGPLREHMQIEAPTSDSFKRWFGQSVVVGDEKKPVVVYHGTNKGGFTEFKPEKRDRHHNSFYVSDDIDVAETYVDRFEPSTRPDPALDNTAKSGIYRLYIRLLNPMIVEGEGKNWSKLDDPRAPRLHKTYELAQWAQDHGHDGVIFKNIVDDGGHRVRRSGKSTVYAVFDPKAIKSATGNNGNFDPSDADIRHNPRRALSMHAGRSTPKSKR